MARSTNSGGAGRTKNHSLLRSGRNKAANKYERQRRRSEANKLARAAAHAARNPTDQVARQGGLGKDEVHDKTPGKGTA